MSRTRRGASVNTCRSHQETCQTFVSGYSWKQKDGSFDRYVIRKCIKCGDRNVQKVHWIELNRPTCLICFKQSFVEVEDDMGNKGLTCSECGNKESVVLRI